MAKIGRNAPCPCGSGKKYKRCCLAAAGIAQADELTDEYRQQRASEAAFAEALLDVVERLRYEAEALLDVVERLRYENDLLEKLYQCAVELIRQRRFDEALVLCVQVLVLCQEEEDEEFDCSAMMYRSRGKYVLAADYYPHVCEIAGLPEQIDDFGDEEVELDREMSEG